MELAGAEGKPSGLTFLSLLPFFRLPFQNLDLREIPEVPPQFGPSRRDGTSQRERERDGGCPSVAVSTQKPSLSPISPPSLLRQRRSPPSSCYPPFGPRAGFLPLPQKTILVREKRGPPPSEAATVVPSRSDRRHLPSDLKCRRKRYNAVLRGI